MSAALFVMAWLACPVLLGISVFQRRWRTYWVGVIAGLVLIAVYGAWVAVETQDVSRAWGVVILQFSAAMVFGLSLATALALHRLKRRATL
jgi:hypothetical protein